VSPLAASVASENGLRVTRALGLTALLAALGATLWLASEPGLAPFAVAYPPEWQWDAAARLTGLLKFLSRELDLGLFTFAELTRGIAWLIERPMLLVQGTLADGFAYYGERPEPLELPPLPWLSVAGASTVLAAWAGGRRLAVGCAVTFVYFAAFGLWKASMLTLASVMVAVSAGVMLGLGLGVAGYRSPRLDALLTPVYDVMQTLPVFSYLVPVLLFFGFGPVAALIATVIFAMPPMARVTTLALARVPGNIHDFATVTGCTRRQMTWWVLLPAARRDLLIGLNQVIMLSLAVVIIASIIGAGGLGADVLRGLKSLRIGEAVEAGVAITLMAIVLDRLSRAVALRRPTHAAPGDAGWVRRHPYAAAAAAAVLAPLPLAPWVPALHSYPEAATLSTGAVWNDVIAWINAHLHGEIAAFRDALIIHVMKPVKSFYLGLPWLGVVLVTAAIGGLVGGLRLALLCAALLAGIAVTGYWSQAMISFYLVSLAVLMAAAAGIPIGILAALSPRLDRPITVVIDTLQTLPTFVYLIPVVMLFSIGEFPALVAIVLYAIAPAIRYTKEGIKNVPRSLKEAADVAGCTRAQRLLGVELPLALPEVMLGINQTVMMAFGMLVITALVGTRGLEQETLIAIGKVRPGEGIVAGLGIAFLAIIVDRLLRRASERLRRRLGLGSGPVAF